MPKREIERLTPATEVPEIPDARLEAIIPGDLLHRLNVYRGIKRMEMDQAVAYLLSKGISEFMSENISNRSPS